METPEGRTVWRLLRDDWRSQFVETPEGRTVWRLLRDDWRPQFVETPEGWLETLTGVVETAAGWCQESWIMVERFLKDDSETSEGRCGDS